MNLKIFYKYLSEHSDIALAFDEHKKYVREEFSGDDEKYKASVSGFINGVLNCADNKDVIIRGERILIRTACIDDADFMSEAERENSPWVGNWNICLRIQKFGDNDFLQTIIEKSDGTPVGFIIFRDMLNENQTELKRIVITEKEKGYGKEALYLAQKFAFEILKTNRLQLGTRKDNIRAQTIYKATGFTAAEPDPCTFFYIDKDNYFKRNQL